MPEDGITNDLEKYLRTFCALRDSISRAKVLCDVDVRGILRQLDSAPGSLEPKRAPVVTNSASTQSDNLPARRTSGLFVSHTAADEKNQDYAHLCSEIKRFAREILQMNSAPFVLPETCSRLMDQLQTFQFDAATDGTPAAKSLVTKLMLALSPVARYELVCIFM
jgi:hypothetical protein